MWICYACETENEVVNPPDGDTDDECQMCGMARPHSDAETRAAALQAEVERLRDERNQWREAALMQVRADDREARRASIEERFGLQALKGGK